MAEEQHRLADDEQMPKIGSQLDDRYEIKSVLGEGGFAAVYKAFDTRTKTDVAIKVLDPIMSRRSEFSARFLREVSTVSQLRHHNTIKIFDSGETDNGCLYLVMELLQGRPLDDIVEKDGVLSAPRVKYIVQQILKSLYEAHERGIIHRDLKPANVFIADLAGEKDYVKVLDFGIAKSLDESQDSSLTATGQVMCSPDYVAPERVRDHLAYPASDIYSLGIMMVEMLDGELPYKGDSPMMVALQHVKMDEPVPMRPETANGPLGWVIRKACSKDLSQRYNTAGEMLEDLASVTFDGVTTVASGSVAGGANTTVAAPAAGAPAAGTSAGAMTAAAPAVGGGQTEFLEPEEADPFGSADTTLTGVSQKNRAVPIIIAALLFVLVGGIVAFFVTSPDSNSAEGDQAAEPQTPMAAVTETGQAEEGEDEPAEEAVEIEPDSISVDTTPAGATVFVNDRELGVAPYKLMVDEVSTYPVRIRVELDGHESQTVTVASQDELIAGIATIRLNEIAEQADEVAAANTGADHSARAAERQREAQREAQARAERERREAEQRAAEERAAAEQAAAERRAAEQAEAEAAAAAAAAQEEEDEPSRPSRIIDLRPRQ